MVNKNSSYLIQSNYGNQGNFQAVFNVGASTRVHHWCRDNDDSSLPWAKTGTFALGLSGQPALIQSNYGDQGNFEVVVKNLAGRLEHWYRDNDSSNPQWIPTFIFGP